MAEAMEEEGRHTAKPQDLSESWSYLPHLDSISHRGMSESYHEHDEPIPMQTVEEDDFPVSYYDRSMDDRFTKSLDLAHSSFFVVGHGVQTEYEGNPKADSWSPEELLNHEDGNNGAAIPMTIPEGQNQENKRTPNGISQFLGSGSRKKSNASESSQTESKIKTTLMSVWNNMRHGWTVKLKTTFKYDDPIFMLGKIYHSTEKERQELQEHYSSGVVSPNSMELFKKDFFSRIWFTYRRDFPPLKGTQLTSDVGWGCMLRSGQMMLAQALVMYLLGRDWRWYNSQKQRDVIFHRQILRYFGDSPCENCPFSIHNLVRIGADMGKKPGDWYGPASVAYVLRDAVEQAPQYDPILGQVCLYVAQDCTVYKQDVIDLCTGTSPYSLSTGHSGVLSNDHSTSPEQSGQRSSEHWRACILLIPVRLGGEALNIIYGPCVQSVLAHDLCVGIIGGKPKHSLYFVGWQECIAAKTGKNGGKGNLTCVDILVPIMHSFLVPLAPDTYTGRFGDKLIHLDPHCCQDMVTVQARDFPVESFHCMSPRKMSLSKMDPSCTIGFYCKTREDFSRFVQEVSQMVSPPKEKGLYPMFVFSSGRSCDISYGDEEREERLLRVSHFNKQGQLKQSSKDSDDFVML